MPNKRVKKTPTVKAPTAMQKARRREMSLEEETHVKIRTGRKAEDIYDFHAREELEENDEITTWEEGFMEGAHSEGEGAKCRNCGKVLLDTFVELELHDEVERFCSEHCAESYEEKHSAHKEE